MDASRRERILAAAAEAFGRYGFKKASIAEIARHAGVGKGTVYLAAPSKEALFLEVLHRGLMTCTARTRTWLDVSASPEALLEQVVAEELRLLAEEPLVRELLVGDINRLLPGLEDRFAELRRLSRVNTRFALERGRDAGVFRADLDLDLVAAIIQDLQVATLMLYPAEEPGAVLAGPRWRTALRLIVDGLTR